MHYIPTYCPNPKCESRSRRSFRWIRRGTFTRKGDKREIQRYSCLQCKRCFSEQTFRVDYRLKLPMLHVVLLRDFVSKVTHRQSARTLGCDRKTVAHRLLLLGKHCREFHEEVLDRSKMPDTPILVFSLDELETHEERRRIQPVTVPVLVERKTHFVVGLSTGAMGSRGNLSDAEKAVKAKLELAEGRRRSESRAAVKRALEYLPRLVGANAEVGVLSDGKSTYPKLIRDVVGARAHHEQHSSKTRRDRSNPLFQINHTLAMLRDGVSRLVRRSWAASKKRQRLEHHMWIWAAWRNYVRGIKNEATKITPAMALGLLGRQLTSVYLTSWKVAPKSIQVQ